MLNLGGPGWFNDVFELECELSNTRKLNLKGFLFQQDVPLFTTTDKVTGKITIKAPPNRTVTHNGVRVELESSIQFYESLNSVNINPDGGWGIEVIPPGSVTDTLETQFEFDLANCTTLGGLPLIESYDGEKFDVRHTLLITINRPWYTFNVNKVIPIAVQHLAGAPAKDEDAKVVANQLGVVSRTPILQVDDFAGKENEGVCTLAYGRSHWNIGDVLSGRIEFTGVIPKPLVGCKLVLYKIEVADGDTQEKSVKELVLVEKESAAAMASETAAGGVRTPPVRTQPVTSVEDKLEVTFPLTGDLATLSPTYEELNEPENKVNVHYYLRLLLEDAEGDKFWNTNEIILYRNKITGVTSADV